MEQELKEFGLTENEIIIYLELLALGTSSPADIAKKTGFSRPYIYDALERLLEKNIVSSLLIKNKKQYKATDPRRLEELAINRLESIQKIIPHLLEIQSYNQDEIQVEVHKGKYVYKTLLYDIIATLKKNDEVLVFGIDDEILMKIDKYTPIYLKQYFARIIKLNIKEKVIARRGNPYLKEAKTSVCRFLPKEIMGNTAFEVYGSTVAIFLCCSPNHLILINNKEVANSYRNQFKILWENAKLK